MASTDEQKWLSSKLEASLMEALDKKAKSIGLSRSEAVRKAIDQWVEGSSADTAASEGAHAEIIERLERIETRLADSEQGENGEASSEVGSGSPQDASQASEDGEGLGQMEMYEGEDLLNWIDSESEKTEGQQVEQS